MVEIEALSESLVLIYDELVLLKNMGVDLKGTVDLEKLKVAVQSLSRAAA